MELKELFAINAEAARIERERCLKAVDEEPELPGEMPEALWTILTQDRDAMINGLRILVRETKNGIRKRILDGV